MTNLSLALPKQINKAVLNILLGIFLLFISAQTVIPLQPIPITLQSMAVIYIGLCFKPYEAIIAVISYIILGLIGLPIFSALSFGAQVLFKPSAGYLIAFIPSVYITALIVQKFNVRNWLPLIVTSLLGTAIIFTGGIIWLTYLTNFENAISVGLLPFILPGVVKSIILVSMLKLSRYFYTFK